MVNYVVVSVLLVQMAQRPRTWFWLRYLVAELEHVGANVLLHFVVSNHSNACLHAAGTAAPINGYGVADTVVVTFMIIGGTRFMFYLSKTSVTEHA